MNAHAHAYAIVSLIYFLFVTKNKLNLCIIEIVSVEYMYKSMLKYVKN